MINDFHLPDTRFLSNLAYAPVLFDGVSYATVEHAYQAAKTLDLEQRKAIKQAATPNQAKQLGKRVTLRANWRGICLDIMLDLLRKKFTIPAMRRALVATGLHELIEGNYWHDTYWGVCNGVGENHLGKLLMQVRNEIIASGYELQGVYMEGVPIHEVDTSNMKPRITRITLSRHRVRWIILMNDGIIGFKKQTQFKHFIQLALQLAV